MPFTAIAAPVYGASGLPGSAGIAALAGGPVGLAVGGAIAALSLALSLVGQGRREADIITPLQNQYKGVLDAVNAALVRDPALSVEQLNYLNHLVADGYAEFEAFTRNPQFTDGRASVQARDTIRPYVDGRNDSGAIVDATGGALGKISRRLDAFSVGGAVPSAISGGGGGVLLVGGAALAAAKLFGFI